MRPAARKHLVIDSDVLIAAVAEALDPPPSIEGEDIVYPRSKYCRDFLAAVRQYGHRIVITPEMREEWSRHNRSAYTRQWLASMERIGLIQEIDSVEDAAFREVALLCMGQEETGALLKDCHLVEAAAIHDNNVSSFDDKARRRFHRVSWQVEWVGEIVWVNPEIAEEESIDWLKRVAPAEEPRKLKNLPFDT